MVSALAHKMSRHVQISMSWCCFCDPSPCNAPYWAGDFFFRTFTRSTHLCYASFKPGNNQDKLTSITYLPGCDFTQTDSGTGFRSDLLKLSTRELMNYILKWNTLLLLPDWFCRILLIILINLKYWSKTVNNSDYNSKNKSKFHFVLSWYTSVLVFFCRIFTRWFYCGVSLPIVC